MQLASIQIENFRSIKSQNITFDYNCLILIGKNEAGKSNILKAIATVFEQYPISNKDKRKRIDNEKIDAYFVRAILELEEADFDIILKRFQQIYKDTECIVFKSGKTLRDCIKSIFCKLLINMNIADNNKTSCRYFKYDRNDFDLEDDIFINDSVLNATKTGTSFDLQDSLFTILEDLYKENQYRCHYWKYNDEYLLPNSVDIADFCNNPTKYKSLQNIFILCNREDIKQEFMNAATEDGDYENLLEQVSKKVTQIFQKIWKDFNNTSIQLRPNGDQISIKIADKAKYACEDRSDGFKKFISILLVLSTQALSGKIGERDIILIDEPDQSLYPTSAKYLRDELLKISEKAKVIYSTHSPYMIDANCIDRHLIVEKKDDITVANKQDKDAQFSNDELLRQAIGSSIFECLQDKNIIFEGWLDKELFQKYCEYNKKTKNFDGIGKVYLSGISGVETLVQLLILANKKFIIVVDSDKSSNDKRKKFNENYKEYEQNWLSYADVVEKFSTMEDFLKSEYIEKHIKEKFPNFTYDGSRSAISNIEAIEKDKTKKQDIKKELIEKLAKTDIKDDYSVFVGELENKINNL
ncbi:MAG: ATP-binding protein [Campylobacteraceae bacterium]|jgi:predicted ATP-dependent endonuclease of OLD family|nr:ATP-binding protein [Campylobacteraceae bacterium]